MKKTFCILTMMLLCGALYAGPVTPEKALRVAQSVFASEPGTKAVGESNLQIVWDGEFEPATKGAQDPAFYVVSRPEGGFVMVSGNDNVQPVLAFSFENDFKVEEMPANVHWWMEELKGYARSAVRSTPEIEEVWEAFAETKAVIPESNIVQASEYLVSRTNLWNQSGPANLRTPTVDGQSQSVCGCVPLALAEIMAWFGTQNKTSYPAAQIEGYNYYAYNTATSKFDKAWAIAEHPLTTSHSWADLKALSSYSDFMGQSATTLGADLGDLVYDIGTILQVKFNESLGAAGGTSGNLGQLEQLTSLMYYNKAALSKKRENFTSSEWITMLVNEINLHPVFYEGQDTGNGGGHAFVADGYATTNTGKQVIHFNFGWGGNCNGYYDCLSDVQTTNGNLNFFMDNAALFGFSPDTDGLTTSVKKLGYFYNSTSGGGVTLSSVTNEKVYINFRNMENSGSAPFTGVVAAFRVDKDGNPGTSPLSIMPILEPLLVGSYMSYDGWDEALISFPVLGDKYAFFYKSSEATDYLPVEGGSSGQVLTELPYYPAAFIKKKVGGYNKNDYFVFELTNHDYRYGNATWTVTAPDGETNTYPQSAHQVQLTSTGWYIIMVSTPEQETITAYLEVQ